MKKSLLIVIYLLLIETLVVYANSAEDHFKRAKHLYFNQKYDEAIREYEEVIKLKPNYAKAHYGLARVYKQKRMYDEAINEYKKAIEIMPSYKSAHMDLGFLYLKRDLKKEAFSEFNKIRLLFMILLFILLAFLSLCYLGFLITFIFGIKKICKRRVVNIEYLEKNWNFKDVLAIILFMLLTMLCIGLIAGVENVMGHLGGLIATVPLGLLPIYFVVRKYKRNINEIGLRWINLKKDILWGGIGVAIAYFTTCFFKLSPNYKKFLQTFFHAEFLGKLVLILIVGGVIAPLCEEIFYRGFLYPLIRKHIGVFWGIIMSSLFFAGMHFNIEGLGPTIIMGIILASLYQVRKTLFPSIITHSLNNIVAIILYSGFFQK